MSLVYIDDGIRNNPELDEFMYQLDNQGCFKEAYLTMSSQQLIAVVVYENDSKCLVSTDTGYEVVDISNLIVYETDDGFVDITFNVESDLFSEDAITLTLSV
jgi:hypothetical protein